ncbi:DUF4235 domain-containing protein [Cellulomonas sp. URHD0024]|uniref:DUF4235 domain-containing protein n=1 Tax=Cellulomonas sp. URHD0024 TaxID=1302620 RepID=UPI0004029897|nr:DUF4235 domain-containing protein [Cellulomonas sp. URHD0024]
MSDKPQSSFLAKIIGAAATLIAAWLAQKLISSVWKARTGHKPPTPDDKGNANLTEMVTAAAVTGALVAISRVLATHGAAHVVAAMEDDDDEYFD